VCGCEIYGVLVDGIDIHYFVDSGFVTVPLGTIKSFEFFCFATVLQQQQQQLQ
jgi:hypothetical protein